MVGRGFIGRAIAAALADDDVRLAAHTAVADPDLLHGVTSIIYAGRHRDLGTPAWSADADPELLLARRAAEARASFLSLSSRKVYAPATTPLTETDRVGPGDLYGRQKLVMEHALLDTLGPRLTRLRLANIIGYEAIPDRRSFMALALASLLRNDEIRFDMSPFVVRDFLPVDICALWIAELAKRPPGGIVNVGSGIPLPAGQLALWLIEGYGRGRLVIESPAERDSFVLDIHHLKSLLGGATITVDAIRHRIVAIGRRLRAERDGRAPA